MKSLVSIDPGFVTLSEAKISSYVNKVLRSAQNNRIWIYRVSNKVQREQHNGSRVNVSQANSYPPH